MGQPKGRATITEVLGALSPVLGYTDDAIEQAHADKAIKRGGFEQRIFLEKAITND